jgi:hypothetical protein
MTPVSRIPPDLCTASDISGAVDVMLEQGKRPMTSAMATRIRHWDPIAIIITIAGARPAIHVVFLLFYFDLIYFWDLVPFVSASLGSSPLLPSIVGNCIECRQCFARHIIARVPIAMSRGSSLN